LPGLGRQRVLPICGTGWLLKPAVTTGRHVR
jgi:hypothetical protein